MLWWTLQKLKSSDWRVRAAAARTLGASRQKKAVPALIKALEDNVGDERQAVIEALGAIGHPASVDALISALKTQPQKLKDRRQNSVGSTEAAECRALAEALAKIGPPALNSLIGLLNSDDRNARRWAAHALGLLKDAKAVNPLIQKLQDSRSEVRQAAARALGEVGDKSAAQALIKILAGKDPETRRAAAEALGALGVEEAVDALGVAAQDPNEPLQLATIEALRRIGGLGAGGRIRSVLETSRKAVREAAAAALASMKFETRCAEDRAAGAVLRGDFPAALQEGLAALDAVISALSSRDAGHRLKAVHALATLHSERAIRSLLGALDDHDRAIQEAAAEALASIGAPALPGLMESLESHHMSVRGLAARALGKIGDAKAAGILADTLTNLRGSLSDESGAPEATQYCLEALTQILSISAAFVAETDLMRVAQIAENASANGRLEARESQPGDRPVQCMRMRKLARQELQRRGVTPPTDICGAR